MRNAVKEMRAALHDGVLAGTSYNDLVGQAGKVTGFLEDALRPEQAHTLDACETHGDASPIKAIGQVAAQTLTSPLLKTGELRSEHNAQLAREIARHIAIPEHRLEVAVGLGGSVEPPSLRLAAYLGPLLEFGDSFAQAGAIVPELRVVAAHQVSAAVNGIDSELARHRALQAQQLLQTLVQHYPDGVQPVFEHLTMDDLVAHGIVADAKHVRELIDTPGPLQPMLRKLMERATAKHANTADEVQQRRTISAYIAAHGLSFHNYRYPEVHGTIKLGGQGEAPFDLMQQHLAERALAAGHHATNRTAHGGTRQVSLRLRAGTIPPYYLEGSEELTVESSPESVPKTASEAAAHYAAKGLRSGQDFGHLPARLRDNLPDFTQ